MIVKIYVLIDPISLKVRYIGRTRSSLNKRLSEHISKAKYHRKYGRKANHKYNWINGLLKINSKPYIRLLTTVNGWQSSHKLERQLIKKYSKSRNLVNKDDFGAGESKKFVSRETRNKISKTLQEKYKNGEIVSGTTKSIFVYDLEGNFINTYSSLTNCSIDLNIHISTISRNLRGKTKQGRGFQFFYEEQKDLKSLKHFHKGRNTPIKICEDGDCVEFKSISECLKHLNIEKLGVNSKTVSNIIQEYYPNTYKVYIKNELIIPSQKTKQCFLIKNGKQLHFNSIQELGEYLQIHKRSRYKSYIQEYAKNNNLQVNFV